MPKEIDFFQKVTAPKEAIDHLTDLINKRIHVLSDMNNCIPTPTIEDEFEVLVALMGVGRLIEYNMRLAWQTYALAKNRKAPSPKEYEDVLSKIEKTL